MLVLLILEKIFKNVSPFALFQIRFMEYFIVPRRNKVILKTDSSSSRVHQWAASEVSYKAGNTHNITRILLGHATGSVKRGALELPVISLFPKLYSLQEKGKSTWENYNFLNSYVSSTGIIFRNSLLLAGSVKGTEVWHFTLLCCL